MQLVSLQTIREAIRPIWHYSGCVIEFVFRDRCLNNADNT